MHGHGQDRGRLGSPGPGLVAGNGQGEREPSAPTGARVEHHLAPECLDSLAHAEQAKLSVPDGAGVEPLAIVDDHYLQHPIAVHHLGLDELRLGVADSVGQALLQHAKRMKPRNRLRFEQLRHTTLRVTRAWAMKETARHMWSYKTRGSAERGWKRLIGWMTRSRLGPMVKAASTLREHLWGIVNAIVLGVTNAHLEAVNAKIQKLEKQACGYGNRARFREAILFHCGGFELYPQIVATHTKS